VERLDAAADALAGTPLGQMSAGRPFTSAGLLTLTAPEVSAPLAPALQARWKTAPSPSRATPRSASSMPPTLIAWSAHRARELVFFSPLSRWRAVPACDALWIPGGYPELHARDASRQHRAAGQPLPSTSQAGKPVWAECGGMMALFDTLTTAGRTTPMRMWGQCCPASVTVAKTAGRPGPAAVAELARRHHCVAMHVPLLHLHGHGRCSPRRAPVQRPGTASLRRMPVRRCMWRPHRCSARQLLSCLVCLSCRCEARLFLKESPCSTRK
jgi:hypothetical protein